MEVTSDLIAPFMRDFNVSMELAVILARRAVLERSELPFFLESDISYAHQPFLFKDMEFAVDRILRARQEKERVLVFGDRDTDGVIGTTIIVKALQKLGMDVQWQVPQGDHGYGINEQDLKDFHEKQGSLVITVDCGISAHNEVEIAKKLGIDILIFDHHSPGTTLPDAYAVIDAKIPEQGYPFIHICGGALAYKLFLALQISQTEIYQQEFCLLNAVPLHEALNIELLCVRNLVPRWQRTITVSPDLQQSKEELASLLSDMPVLVFDADQQKKLIQKHLGERIDLYFSDIRQDCTEYIPEVRVLSLLQIQERMHFAKYANSKRAEIELLYQMYVMIMTKKLSCFKETADEIADLVSIATVADIMPLCNENRILLKQGLKRISHSNNIGLATLLERLKLYGKRVYSNTIGWKISPVINAAGRMRDPSLAVSLFLADDREKAEKIVQELLSYDKQRISLMETFRKEVSETAEKLIEKQSSFILLRNDNIPHPFTGIVANNLLRNYRVPAIVMTYHNKQHVVASIRCDTFLNATHLIEDMRFLLLDGGGHRAAAGFSFDVQNYERVLNELEQCIPQHLSRNDAEDGPQYQVDLEIPEKYFNLHELKALALQLEPYGEKWDTPTLLFREIPVIRCDLMGANSQHARLILKIGNYHIPALIWNVTDFPFELSSLHPGTIVSLLTYLRLNIYNGSEQISLVVRDIDCHSGEAKRS